MLVPANNPNLVAYYRFEEGSGLTTLDATSNHNDGDLGGAAFLRPTWDAVDGAPLVNTGGTANVVQAIDRFNVTFSEDLLATAANNPNNYTLLGAGADNIFGTADDVTYAITPTYSGSGSRVVSFTIAPNPLQAGLYQFKTLAGLTDRAGNSVTPYTLNFQVSNPQAGVIEGTAGDDTIPGATALPMTEFPVGSGFFTALGLGTYFDTNDRDYWRFDAQAGDHVTIRLGTPGGTNLYPLLYLQNASGTNQTTTSGDYNGNALIQNYTITAPGTYYVYVGSQIQRGELPAPRRPRTRRPAARERGQRQPGPGERAWPSPAPRASPRRLEAAPWTPATRAITTTSATSTPATPST